jgi:hypothetical protein
MKKTYKARLSSFRKASRGFIMAATLAIMGTGISYGQTLIDESFTGQTLPTGWDTSNVIGNWAFDNPSARSISGGTPGFSGDFAIFDSDDICSSNEEGTLESPAFNASTSGVAYVLEFDNSFRSYVGAGQEGHVEVWNGTAWTSVLVLSPGASDGYPNPASHKVIDITSATSGSSAAKIRFRSINGNCNWWWAIDNVTVKVISCPTPTGITSSNVTSGSADIAWTAPSPAPANGYQYYYNTMNVAPTSSTTASGSVAAAITTAGLTSLTANTQYYVWVRSICSATDTSDWSSSATFTTLPTAQIPATLPYSDDFTSTGANWTRLNGTEANTWYVGNANGNTGNSLYVTNDGGITNAYTTSSATSVVHAYRDIILPAGTNSFNLAFDWECLGEGTSPYFYDYFRIWVVPNTYVPTPGTQITALGSGGIQLGGNINDAGASSASWHSDSYIIPNTLAGDTVRVVFEWKNDGSSGSQPPAAIDNVQVTEITCSAPTTLVASNVTSGAADIGWAAVASNPSGGYQYYYSTSSAAPNAGTAPSGSVGVGVTTASISLLTANMQYYFWVRAICSSTDTSDWSTSASFTTLCGSIAAPATYDVESATATTNSTIGDCWSSTPSGTTSSYRWNVVGSGGSTPSSSTGPSGPHSGSKYFYTEASNGSTGAEATLTSPLIDVSALTLPSLAFYYHMYGSTMGNLYIEASDGITWSTLDSIKGQQQTSATDPWLQKSIVLTGYTGTIQVRFRAIRGSNFYGDMSVDDISVVETPTCFSPTQLTVATITDISAAVSWTAASPAPANGYEYYYNTTNIAPTNTTVASGSVGAGVTTASLTGLSAVNTYYVWVRSICSATDTSDWSSSATFTTLPTAQIPGTLPYSDDFTSTGGNWTLLNGTETNVWYVGNANGNTGNSLYVTNDGGTTNAYTTSSATSVVQAYRDIILPPGTNSFNLAFDWECLGEGTSPYFYDYFRIWVVPNSYVPTPGTQITALGSGGIQFGADINDAGASSASWHSDSYIIPNTLAGDTVRLVFEWNNDVSSGSQPPAAIDNINVTEITCSAPTALVASNISTTGATLSWTAPTTAPANGYQYYYSTSNVAPTSSTTASGSVGAATVTAGLTPLIANTQYYVWVRSVCSATDTSDWTGGITFTTLCNSDPIPYTVPLAAVTTPDIPSCMSTQLINTLGSEWYTSNSPGSGFTGKTLVSEYTGFGDGDVDSWVYTNGLLLTGGLSYQIHYRYGNNSTSYAEKLAVKYGTTTDASSMTTLLADHTNIDDATPHDTTVSFTPATTGTYYIGFHAHSIEDQYLLYVDSIMVTLAPCDAAVALTTSNITSSSADLSWTGNAAQYTLEYGSSGFTPGAGTTVSVTGNSYSLGNLDPNNTYDYYVRSICSPGLDSSAYSIAATFTTVCDTVVVALGNDTAICSGSSLILDAGNPTATFVWSDASTAQTLSVSAAGSYYVTATNVYGCSGTDTLTLTINALPVVDLGSDTGICVGDTLSLDAGNSGSTYLWNNASTVQILNATVAGDYYVTVTNTNNCSGSDTLTLTVNALPVLDLGSDTSLCAGDTLSLDAGNAGSTYLWNDASTLQTLQADTTGDYYVMVTDTNGCAATDTFTLTVNALPIVNLGPDTSLCAGDTLTLDAGNPGSAYLWSDTSMLQTLDVFAANDYWVSVTDTNGCSAADTIHLNITLPPSIDSIIVTDNGNGTYTFGVAGAQNVVSYTWDFGDGSALSYSPNPTHTYANTGTDSITVTVIVENECGSDSASVRIPGIGVGIQQVDPGITQLKLYPNPAQDLITIQNESSFKMEAITVYNMLGQVVFQAATRATHHYQLDLSGYASGMYNVRIQLSSGFVMRKFEVLK